MVILSVDSLPVVPLLLSFLLLVPAHDTSLVRRINKSDLGAWLYAELSYFTLPASWQNGTAANLTATALETANNVTLLWFNLNHEVTGEELNEKWVKNIKDAMRALGGDFGGDAPFTIPSPAPYTEEVRWSRTDCSR